MSDPVIKTSPGPLRSHSRLTIHTRQAQRLIEGRAEANRPPILGLLSFGKRMRSVWLSASHDDPYADWFLLRIETEIEQTRKLLEAQVKVLTDLLAGIAGVQIDVAVSMEPIEVELSFANPFGYIGAFLVADYDELCRRVFTARHFGLIDRVYADKLLHNCGNALRRTFQYSAGWRFTGVTRDDMRHGTETSKQAIEFMGELPEPQLNASVRAKCSPMIRSGAIETAGEMTLGFEAPKASAEPVRRGSKKPASAKNAGEKIVTA
jgi:integrating conjugative element protein (TIGR03761 family)